MRDIKQEALDKLHRDKCHVESKYQQGLITEYELAAKLVELYDEAAHEIGMAWIHEHKKWGR